MFEREESSRGGGFALGLVVGTLLGAVVALAYAPERGEVTRKRMKRRLRDAGESAREALTDAAGEMRDEVSRRRRDIARNLGV
jgi:gas vesicle protein